MCNEREVVIFRIGDSIPIDNLHLTLRSEGCGTAAGEMSPGRRSLGALEELVTY